MFVMCGAHGNAGCVSCVPIRSLSCTTAATAAAAAGPSTDAAAELAMAVRNAGKNPHGFRSESRFSSIRLRMAKYPTRRLPPTNCLSTTPTGRGSHTFSIPSALFYVPPVAPVD